MNRHKAASINI